MIRAFGPGEPRAPAGGQPRLYVLGWALAVTLSGILVGLAPAMTMSRRDLRSAGAEGGRGVAGGVATRLRRALVVAECAVAIVLLVGAGLLVRSWWNVMHVDPGFQTGAGPFGEPSRRRRPAEVAAAMPTFYDCVLEQVTAFPASRAPASAASCSSATWANACSPSNGRRHRTRSSAVPTDEVSTGFFGTLGTPLLRGRSFRARIGPTAPPRRDRQRGDGAPHLARARSGGPAVHARTARTPTLAWFTVVGVVGDMRRQGLETEPVPADLRGARAESPRPRDPVRPHLVGDPLQLAAPLRAAVRRVERTRRLRGRDRRRAARELLTQRRLQTSLLIGFSVVALLLATIGIYGLIQYRSRRARRRSAFAWRSAPEPVTSSAWSWARG